MKKFLKACGMWMPSAHQSCSFTPLISWTGETKCNKRGHESCQQNCSSVGFSLSLHGCRDSARLPMRPQSLLGLHLLWCGVLHGRHPSTPPRTCMGCSRTACFTIIFPMGCRENCSSAWSSFSPPSSLSLMSAEQLLSDFLTFLTVRCFFPLY